MKVGRISGLDVAYVLAMPMIIYISTFLELGQRSETFIRDQFHILYDGSVAAFLFLSGLTASLKQNSPAGPRLAQRYLIIRGGIFVIFGLILSFFWPTNLFVLLGLCSFVLAIVLPFHTTLVFFALAVMAVYGLFTYFFKEISTNLIPWEGYNPKHIAFYFLRDGYYGLAPWLIFMLAGGMYCRTDFLRKRSQKSLIGLGAFLLLSAFGLEFAIERFTNAGYISKHATFTDITFLHLTLPSFLVGGFGFSMLLLHLAIQLNDRMDGHPAMSLIRKVGRIKYTALALFCFGGIAAGLLISGPETFGIRNIILLSVLLVAGIFVFTHFWLKRFDTGPVERVMNIFNKRR